MKITINNKRLIIYFIYDKDGIVDRYIEYMLKDLSENCSELFIVVNGKLTSTSRKKIKKYADKVLVRENKGLDVWAYKEAMESYGISNLGEMFDEVVLMNSTIMGPVYPFEEMFREMNARDLDFWGITVFHQTVFDPFGKIQYKYIPKHIQSHFISIRKNMLNSLEFINYWRNIPEITSYVESVCYHESIFTKKFNDMGFVWDVYINTDELEKNTYAPILYRAKYLVEKKKCPIFKRRSFFHSYDDVLNFTEGREGVKLFKYLDENTSYNVDFILENIIRTQNLEDINNNLHFTKIIDAYQINNTSKNVENLKIALFIHIYFIDLISYVYKYAKSMPNESDIIITTNSIKKKNLILEKFKNIKCKNLIVEVVENRGRDVSALLVGLKKHVNNYDLVCFTHDKKVSQLDMSIKGEEFSDKLFENLLKSSIFVKNIINEFNLNPRLGLLTPPPPFFAEYYGTVGKNDWGDNFELTNELSKKIGLNVNLDKEKRPISPLGTMFWFRPQSLKLLFDYDWTYNKFPKEPNKIDNTILHAIERIYPFVAQEHGFYSAWVLNNAYASAEIDNLYYMLRKLNKTVFYAYGANTHHQLISTIQERNNLYSESYEFKLMFRKLMKNKFKSMTPKFIWEFYKKIYYFFGKKL